MNYPTDLYAASKEMLSGTLNLNPAFREISEWIFNKFEVKPLYLAYRPTHSMLHLIFHHPDDLIKFQEGSKKIYQTVLKSRTEYREILLRHGMKINEFLHLNVETFRQLAIKSIFSESDLADFQQKSNIPSLWKGYHLGSYKTVFFFFTEKDKIRFDTADNKNFLRDEFYRYLKKEDEYNFLEKDRMIILVDSKDNFINNYRGSMQYYFRDH